MTTSKRKLGADGPVVSAIGLGCMSFAGVFGETDEATSHRCLDAAIDHGIDFLDTANVYGMGRSETVIGGWLAKAPRDVRIATKGGIVRDPEHPVNNAPDHLRQELEGSLRRLGVDHVALYYIHRHQKGVPIEDIIGTLRTFIDEGKIGGYGLSEIAPHTLRRAHAVHPCTAVQSEYSLWSRMPELGLVHACRELGTTFVPFSPLARGVLGHSYPVPAKMAEGDYRLAIPRFSPENYAANCRIIDGFKAFATAHGWTVSALALAWLLDREPTCIPIPGTRSAEHLAEWANADSIKLTEADRAEINRLLPPGFAHGDRYSDNQMRTIERYC